MSASLKRRSYFILILDTSVKLSIGNRLWHHAFLLFLIMNLVQISCDFNYHNQYCSRIYVLKESFGGCRLLPFLNLIF